MRGTSSSRGPSKCPDPVDVEQAVEEKMTKRRRMRRRYEGATDQEGLLSFSFSAGRKE